MKNVFAFFIFICLISCYHTSEKINSLQSKVDSLQNMVAGSYKPGFGEFMTSVQSHHAKLWFAGQNENWKLADFETHEIMEALENIKKFELDRKEANLIGMVMPALDTVNAAIQQKSLTLFTKSYYSLTKSCNDCHIASSFEFNIVTIPKSQNFSNQDFRINKFPNH